MGPAAESAVERPITVSAGTDNLRSATARKLFLGLFLAVITIALYSPVRHYQFVSYDDGLYITDNFHIKYGLSWKSVQWALRAQYADNWHPLTWLSHALDCQLFFLNPGRHHATNLLLHAMNAVLLYWVLLRATGFSGRSFMVAALFALHPINVESVAWVSERKNLLSLLFFLLALGAYRWYVAKPSVRRYAAVALLFALGLMAKPQVITLPFVLLLWDYWPLRRMFAGREGAASQSDVIAAKRLSWLALEKLPLLLLVAASAAITLHAQREAATPYSFSVRAANAIVSYAWYVRKAFWPSHLALLYPHPAGLPPMWQVMVALLFLFAVTALVVAARRRRYLVTGWLWFLGTLVPMIGLVQVGRQAMADRYAYLPLIGLFLMICWGVAEWAEQLHLRPVRPALLLPTPGTRTWGAAWLPVASVAVLLALAVVAHRQIGYWKDSYALWSRSLQVTSPNKEAEDNLGVVLLNDGRPKEALPHFEAAAALDPGSPIYNLNLAICEHRLGDLTDALEHYQAVVRLTQNDASHYAQRRHDAFYYMSFVYRDLGDFPHSLESQEEARKILTEYGEK